MNHPKRQEKKSDEIRLKIDLTIALLSAQILCISECKRRCQKEKVFKLEAKGGNFSLVLVCFLFLTTSLRSKTLFKTIKDQSYT